MGTVNYNELAAKILDRRNIMPIHRFTYDVPNAVDIFKEIGQQLSMGEFVVNEDNRFVYENTLRWLLGQEFKALNPRNAEEIVEGDVNKGLYIAGPYGTGKSVLLRILSAISYYANVEYESDRRKIKLIWADNRADDICNTVVLSGIDTINRLRNMDVLNINDFGSGTTEQVYMGNRINAIRLILESRADAYGKFTLITSNYPMSHPTIAEQYGGRVVSRLSEMCNYFELKGQDWRKRI